jgi:hypothetical protein
LGGWGMRAERMYFMPRTSDGYPRLLADPLSVPADGRA